ncbi:unnamed protein product [Ectocarpus fasciculatus]
MENGRSGRFPPQRRHSVASASIWPWQTTASPPGRPRSSAAQYPKRPYSRDQRRTRRASTGDVDEGTDDGKVGQFVEDAPVAGDGLGADAGNEAEKKEAGGSKGLPIEAFADQDEGWPPMTKTEKRRLWLKRRRSGEFYFRSEFKGLVHAVMESRGWKPSCPPRVPDECLTVPHVDSWEEPTNGFDPAGPGCGQPDERDRLALPAVFVAQAEDGATGREDDPCGDSDHNMHASEITLPQQQEDDNDSDNDDVIVSSTRPCQPWDLHWSYTKWAVETMRFARKLAPWQKVNHFRNSNELCRKDLMLKNLKKRRAQLHARGELAEAQEYNFFPVSFEMPKDYALFVEEFKESGGIWVMKPSGAAEGKGIFLFTKLSDVKAWAKPHLIRRMKRHDPANPGSFVVQRYISNPYVIGGKKFDLRLYVLVTSFRPLTVYIYRDGFAKFSSTRADPAHLANELMHLTNHAVQRRGSAVGKKWSLKKFKWFVAMRHGRKAMDKLFWEIQALVVRTIRSVDRLIIHDKQSFELFGYDVLVDETLRPWLLEVNASPSLGASNRDDLRLKKQMVGDALDIVDVEGRQERLVPVGSPVREHVGGFDLAFHKGYVEVQPQACGYSSFFGAVVRNRVKPARRAKADKARRLANAFSFAWSGMGKFSCFPLPRACRPHPGPNQKTGATSGTPQPIVMYKTSNETMGLETWRPNIYIFRPQDYWKGSVDYVPWKSGDGVCASDGDVCRAPSREEDRTALRKDGGDCSRSQFGLRSKNADPSAPRSRSAMADRCQNIKGNGPGVLVTQSCADESGGYTQDSSGGDGVEVERCASGGNAFRKDAELVVALRGVLNALRRVREERLR